MGPTFPTPGARPARRRLAAAVLVLVLGAVLPAVATSPPAAASAHPVLEGQITRLYSAYFLRAPDRSGLDYWVDQRAGGFPLTAISGKFAASPEFRSRYGTLGDEAFVDLVYRNVLDRAPDADGRAYWLHHLRQGRTRGWVMVGFSESAEYVSETGTAPRPRAPRPLAVGPVALRQQPDTPNVFDNSDPSVLVTGGRTYLFGSTNNMRVPVREITTFDGDLRDSQRAWARSPGDAMPTRPAWVDPGEPQIWAPSVARIDGRYHMYFAAARAGAVDEGNDQCIGRAIATSPTGPYTPDGAPIYCGLPAERGSNPWGRGALDPEVVTSAHGGRYLLVALSRTIDNIGAVRLDRGGNVVGGPNASPAILARQSADWHDGVEDGVRRSAAFLENPSMIYEPSSGTYLLFYSAGEWRSARYVTGFARCASPLGPCVADGRGPFLVSGNGRSGPGGLTTFHDAAGTPRVAYASWTAGSEGQSGNVGEYSRQTHFQVLSIGASSEPAHQGVALR